jgi:hypothetical protein
MTWKRAVGTIVTLAVGVGVGLLLRTHRLESLTVRRSIPIEGAVIQRDKDPQNQLPIADALVTASDGTTSVMTHSDASGYFKLIFPKGLLSGQPIVLLFRHQNYEPLTFDVLTGRIEAPEKLYIAKLVPVPQKARAKSSKDVAVSNIRVRYTINSVTSQNVGSVVKTFQVVNQGNIPCDKKLPCSPDRRWKASTSSASLDAGTENAFGNVRVSCIAGPCPFTKASFMGETEGKRLVNVSALDWSDTATFLLEAEVFHTALTSNVRESYPVIFDGALNFTLPPTQEGVSLEADIDGAPMVFPLGPNLYLSWANCTARTDSEKEKATVYRCELKPGYSFGAKSSDQ